MSYKNQMIKEILQGKNDRKYINFINGKSDNILTGKKNSNNKQNISNKLTLLSNRHKNNTVNPQTILDDLNQKVNKINEKILIIEKNQNEIIEQLNSLKTQNKNHNKNYN